MSADQKFYYVRNKTLTCAGTRLTLSIQIIRDSKAYATISKSNSTVDWFSDTIGCYIARWHCNIYVYQMITLLSNVHMYVYIQ